MLRLPPAIARLRGIRLGNAVKTALRSGEMVVALLPPVGALAFALSAWCLTFDLGLTFGFPVSEGPLAHWIVWAGIGLILEFCAVQLKRLARMAAKPEPAAREIQRSSLQTTVEAE